MTFQCTLENEKYLKARGKVILNACPGSGKTSAIAYKLTLLSQECDASYGKFVGIASLSFTNVAKDEILTKFEKLSSKALAFPHIASTIDSFINKYITLPYYYLLKRKSTRPVILNSVDFIDSMNLGWFKTKKGLPLSVIYKPSKLKFEMDGSITWNGSVPDPGIVDPVVFDKFSNAFKNWQLDNGYLNNDDSANIALQLLRQFPQIGKNLAQRFPYVVVDEAQDTSELQYEIFDELTKCGLTNLEYVGDPYQSLYEFRQARPDLFIKKYEDNANWNACELSFCRRSSQKIIDLYQIFRKAGETPLTSICKHTTDLPVKVLKYDEGSLDTLVNTYTSFIDTNLPYQILVRGTSHLEMFGVKPLPDNPWKIDISKNIVIAAYKYDGGNIKDSIDILRKVYVELKFSKADPKQKLEEENKLKEDYLFNITLHDFIKNIPSVDATLIDWTSKTKAYIKAYFGVDIDLQLKQKGAAFYAQNTKALLYPQTTLKYPVSTIHKVKGMTFNSILLVLSENSSGERISINDFSTPADLPTEKQRMIYVALSRPETFACIAVPKKVSDGDIKARLANVEIIDL